MQQGLTGRVALVTGAGSGIGLACARHLHAAGALVAGADLRVDALRELGGPDRVLPLTADLREADAAAALVAAAAEAFGRVDVLVNNAGAAAVRPGFLDTTDADWTSTLELNLLGYVRAARAAIPAMLDGGGGALVHIASEAARMPNPRLPDYSVSKAGVLMLSKVLAAEFTPAGVRSNVVSPAFIRTPLYDRPGGLADSLAEEFGVDRRRRSPATCSSTAFRPAGSARSTRWPRWSPISPPTRPASSPARTSASTAASRRSSSSDEDIP